MPRKRILDNMDLVKAVHRSQHCQRNWNLEQTMPEEDIATLIEAVTQCPSKQNKAFYSVTAITQREKIESIHEMTKGFGAGSKMYTNPQTLAHLLLVFSSLSQEEDEKMLHNLYMVEARNRNDLTVSKEEKKEHIKIDLIEQRMTSIGIAAGYANLTASLMGYGTGCCACFDQGTVKSFLNIEGQPLLLMGIGISGEKTRRLHHTEDFKFPTFKKSQINLKTYF